MRIVHRHLAAQRGFTLIEIMIVVVIIGVLGALIVPQFMGRPEQAKITAARSDLKAIATAIEMYRLDNGHYPSTEQGLEALVTRPQGEPPALNWSPRGYLRQVPIDPWGTPYQYVLAGSVFTLRSFGADKQPGGIDGAADIDAWAP